MPKDRGIQLIDNNDEGPVLDVKINVVRDASGKIVSGVVIGNTLEQNKAMMLITRQGENKFRPDAGVGIQDLTMSEDYLPYRHRIREHFAKDGLVVENLDLYPGKPININAKYER